MSEQSFLKPTYRANPQYQLVVYDRLDAAVQAELAELATEPSFYGILEPDDPQSGLPVKAVDTDMALLFLTLRDAGPIPNYISAEMGSRSRQLFAELVLNNVLEMATSDGGQFVSGAQAHAVLPQRTAEVTTTAMGTATAQLSEAAVRYGALLAADHRNGSELAQRLYAYNTIPISAEWRRTLPDADAVRAFLGIEASSSPYNSDKSAESNGWIAFRSRSSYAFPKHLPYKLYVSPQPKQLPTIWNTVVAAFAKHNVPAFKVGNDAHGLLRPDKLVAYLPDMTALHAVADTLHSELAGIPAQGVPFTAPIDPDGLLSWGMDPPNSASDIAWHGRQSWRLWIAGQLATALVEACRADIAIAPWRYALDKLTLLGVDTTSWTPQQTLWQNGE